MNPHIQRARAAMEVKRWEVAQQALVEALSQDPDNGMLHALRAEAFYRETKYEEARAAARDTIAAEPDRSYGYYWLAWAIISDKSVGRAAFKRAKTAADDALSRGPDDPNNYELRAEIAQMAGNANKALRICYAGLALDPGHINLRLNVARAHINLERYVEAESILEDILGCEPTSAYAHYHLARVALLTDQFEKAYEHSATALQNDPNMYEARDVHRAAMSHLHSIAGALLRYPGRWLRIEPFLWNTAGVCAVLILISPLLGETLLAVGGIGFLGTVFAILLGMLGKLIAEIAAETVITFSRRFTTFDPDARARRLGYAFRWIAIAVAVVTFYVCLLVLLNALSRSIPSYEH